MKYIESIASYNVELEGYECQCGFHIGLDSTYLEQVGDIEIICPSCKATLHIEGS